MYKGQSITLTEEDQEEILALAKGRYETNRKNGVEIATVGPQSDKATEIQGLAGEFAFCRLAGIEPDRTLHSRSAKTDPGDATINGITIDVKTSKHKNARMIAAISKKKCRVDAFVLMIGKFPKYTYKGAIEKHVFIQGKNIKNIGYGPTYVLDQHMLKDLDELEIPS